MTRIRLKPIIEEITKYYLVIKCKHIWPAHTEGGAVQVRDIQKKIENSLAKLSVVPLPDELEGLRHLPLDTHRARVGIHSSAPNGKVGRKVREDASASYFDPDTCEVVISFVPLDESQNGPYEEEDGISKSGEKMNEFDRGKALDQLIGELRIAERVEPFVGLEWFREQILPKCDYDWARNSSIRASVLRRATDENLILTIQAPNPKDPIHPVTAIRVNRSHPRFQTDKPSLRTSFKPIRIHGGAISDTAISDRR